MMPPLYRSIENTPQDNPLLSTHIFFPYQRLKVEHIPPAVDWYVRRIHHGLKAIESQQHAPTWENTMGVLETVNTARSQFWRPILHWFGVNAHEALTEAILKAKAVLVPAYNQLNQSSIFHQRLRTLLEEHAQKQQLLPAQVRSIELTLRRQTVGGVHLDDAQKQKFQEISLKRSQLSIQFDSNCTQAVKDYRLVVEDPDHLEGMPATDLVRFSENYEKIIQKPSTAQQGPWLIQIDPASYVSVLNYCSYEPLRKKILLDAETLNSQGAYDNTAIIKEILSLRKEVATMLGFQHYADVSLYTKMADSVQSISDLLAQVEEACQKSYLSHLGMVRTLKKKITGSDVLEAWDQPYWVLRFLERFFNYDSVTLKEYFPLDAVLTGLKTLIHRLFAVEMVPITIDKSCLWGDNGEVRVYEIKDVERATTLGTLFLDPYARPGTKRGGAWMDPIRAHHVDAAGTRHRPIAYIVCNFSPPTSQHPSLLRFREVKTLFHEFGHALQQLLSEVDVEALSGIDSVEWDAVELPSQFMENWCYHKKTLQGFSQHYQTKQPLPDDIYHLMILSKNFGNGAHFLHQIAIGKVDLFLHSREDIDLDRVYDYNKEISRKTLHKTPDYPHQGEDLSRFFHIFAGDYAAGYYSYLWGQVMSDDAFSRFEQADPDDLEQQRKIGMEFRKTVLALGGSAPTKDIFIKFRGREPKIDALLHYEGLQ